MDMTKSWSDARTKRTISCDRRYEYSSGNSNPDGVTAFTNRMKHSRSMQMVQIQYITTLAKCIFLILKNCSNVACSDCVLPRNYWFFFVADVNSYYS